MTAAVPNPRFRDQLAKWISEKTRNPSGSTWGWWSNELTEAADELLALIAGEVEAHVQAAANQRAAERAWSDGYEACRRGEQKRNPYRAAPQTGEHTTDGETDRG